MVLKSNTEKAGRVATLQINKVKSDVPILPSSAPGRIREILIQKMEASKAFNRVIDYEGGDIILDVKVVYFEAGDQFTRWFWTGMGGWGAGEIELESTYRDGSSGEEIAKIKTNGIVSTGFFGGSIESAYSRAVTEIVDYTVKEFGVR